MSKVLIVDDERLIIEYVSKLLDTYGYEYDFIPKPKFLYQKLDSDNFDLILLDINMEGQDGVNILKELKSNDKYKDITVIMMTGEANQSIISTCFELGVADYITKPIRELEFKARVHSVMKLREFMRKLNKQNEELASSKKTIMESLKQIRDSIDAAKRIQNALLPPVDKIKSTLPETFIFYKPKDVVSGDFYWFDEISNGKGNKMVLFVGDCTGHGVPGAFMTALGTTLLKEILHNQHVTEPNKVLDHLNNNLTNILKQEGHDEQVQEGMDAAICTIDTASKTLEFSGAKMPLVFVKNGAAESVKGSLKSIGIQPAELARMEYNREKIKIESGTMFYLFTDGFQDQLNEENNKKYSRKRLMEVFGEMAKLSMDEQVGVLEKEFEKWKGENNQIDDILILGFRIA